MNSSKLRWVLLVAVLAIIGFVAARWLSPGRGVERCWAGFLDAIEDREWEEVAGFMAADYRDGWSQDRAQAVALAEAAFQDFIVLRITREQAQVQFHADGNVSARAILRVGGQGGPIAQAVINGSAGLDVPTNFEWRRLDWRPWAWELTRIDNPAAEAEQAVRRLERGLRDLPAGF